MLSSCASSLICLKAYVCEKNSSILRCPSMIMSPTNEIYIAARLGAYLPLASNWTVYPCACRALRFALCALRCALCALRFALLRYALCACLALGALRPRQLYFLWPTRGRQAQRHRHQSIGGQLETLRHGPRRAGKLNGTDTSSLAASLRLRL